MSTKQKFEYCESLGLVSIKRRGWHTEAAWIASNSPYINFTKFMTMMNWQANLNGMQRFAKI
ncbi:hypothetical protein LZ480_09715 [Solibacillus sp. MA9]|uniref:Uncharacterized protein n=1 Tax=Solibacillus palustris TaxID=2908203 RepID=A0ABS9UCV5_9BACL|nr:hypothetical protein [Solibacillus sp. MA9]MCH7322166.1 hypothetical protein [Solibacillus sp. MA9]